MKSIRKIKKLLKRNPIFIELSMPPHFSHNEIYEGLIKPLKQRLGEETIIIVFPKEEQPKSILKINEDFQDNKELLEEFIDEIIFTPLPAIAEENNFKIHSIVKLTSKQHKAIIETIKTSKSINF